MPLLGVLREVVRERRNRRTALDLLAGENQPVPSSEREEVPFLVIGRHAGRAIMPAAAADKHLAALAFDKEPPLRPREIEAMPPRWRAGREGPILAHGQRQAMRADVQQQRLRQVRFVSRDIRHDSTCRVRLGHPASVSQRRYMHKPKGDLHSCHGSDTVVGMASEFDYQDPGTSPAYCDNHSEPPPDFACVQCGTRTKDDAYFPYCSLDCAARAEGLEAEP